jgi:hypothetical protein
MKASKFTVAQKAFILKHGADGDLAPNFYPVLSLLRRLIMLCWAGCAKAMGA